MKFTIRNDELSVLNGSTSSAFPKYPLPDVLSY